MLLLDELERQVLADRHVAAVLMAVGAKDVTLPSIAEQRALFDLALVEEPKAAQIDTEEMQLRRALGVT